MNLSVRCALDSLNITVWLFRFNAIRISPTEPCAVSEFRSCYAEHCERICGATIFFYSPSDNIEDDQWTQMHFGSGFFSTSFMMPFPTNFCYGPHEQQKIPNTKNFQSRLKRRTTAESDTKASLLLSFLSIWLLYLCVITLPTPTLNRGRLFILWFDHRLATNRIYPLLLFFYSHSSWNLFSTVISVIYIERLNEWNQTGNTQYRDKWFK